MDCVDGSELVPTTDIKITLPYLDYPVQARAVVRRRCPAGGRLRQGAAHAQGVPRAFLWSRDLHGYPFQPRLLVSCCSLLSGLIL